MANCTFALSSPVDIRASVMTPLQLEIAEDREWAAGVIQPAEHALQFRVGLKYEVLLTVEWDTTNVRGHRFTHTKISDGFPLHSEAIEAAVLTRLSAGRQLLRGVLNPVEGEQVALEVWHDADSAVTVNHASLEFRVL
jgi:hypothetical protein